MAPERHTPDSLGHSPNGHAAHGPSRAPDVSVVVPAFNEEDNLRPMHARLTAALESCCASHEIIFIDDGSRDQTLAIMRDLARHDPRVGFISFSRNFGHEIATTAGIDRARGNAVVLIDADLQDPPELIPAMVARWRDGVDVVYAQRRQRAGESPIKRLTSWFFYRIIDRLSDVSIPRDTGDFRLMSARVADAVRNFHENPRFIRGIVAWVGFRQEALPYDRDARHAGHTKYNFRQLLRLSIEAIAAFSLKPLKITLYLGALAILIAFALSLMIVVQRLTTGQMPQGYALLMCSVFFLGGVQLVMLGILAHYVGQVFRLAQRRPLYLVAESHAASPSPTTATTTTPTPPTQPSVPTLIEPKPRTATTSHTT